MTKPSPTTKITPAIREGLLMGPTRAERRAFRRAANIPFDAANEFRDEAKPTRDAITREVRRRESQASRTHFF